MPSIIYEFAKKIFRLQRQTVLRLMAYRRIDESFLHDIERILIIAPHPDDEIFGCGGLLAGRNDNDKRTDILFLTNGEASHKDCCTMPKKDIAAMRQRLAISASEKLNVPQARLHFLDGQDGELPRQDQFGFVNLAEKIAACLEKLAPEAVFSPHPFEGWSDHIAAEELIRVAITMLPKRPKLYYYCVWFWHNMPLKKALQIDWQRAHLLDISSRLPLKHQAMRIYLDALAPCGHPLVGKLPLEILRAFDWDRELFFEADRAL